MRKQHAAHDDGRVVDQGRECGKEEQPPRKQDRRNYSADIKENLGRQQDARQVNAKVKLLGAELGEKMA